MKYHTPNSKNKLDFFKMYHVNKMKFDIANLHVISAHLVENSTAHQWSCL